MKSRREPHEPNEPNEPNETEPSEITEAFRDPGLRLDPPPGAFSDVRRRAAARRRRRVYGVAAAVAVCVGGATAVAGMVGASSGESTVTAPPAGDERSATAESRSGDGEREARDPASTGPDDPARTSPDDTASPPGSTEPEPDVRSPAATETQPREPAAPPVCDSGGLQLTYEGENAGAGSIYVTLVLTNIGDSPCALTGFPGVSLVTAENGEQIGAAADRGPEREGATRVEIDPGEAARADLQMTRSENYPAEDCDPEAAGGLRVYPPDETEPLFLPLEGLTGCADREVSLLSVTTVY